MIENKIDELIAAIHGLTVALGNAAIAPTQTVSEAPTPPAPEPEPVKAAPTATSLAVSLVAEIENKCRMLTRKDPKGMRDKIVRLLETYDSKTIKGVAPDRLAELSAELDALDAG